MTRGLVKGITNGRPTGFQLMRWFVAGSSTNFHSFPRKAGTLDGASPTVCILDDASREANDKRRNVNCNGCSVQVTLHYMRPSGWLFFLVFCCIRACAVLAGKTQQLCFNGNSLEGIYIATTITKTDAKRNLLNNEILFSPFSQFRAKY